MPIFPFYQYPYNMNRYYARNNYNKNISKESNNFDTSYNPPDSNNDINSVIETNRAEDKKNKSSRYSGFGPIHFQNPFDMDSGEPIIEILGISLYLDDIIILGLLFFLYQEGVKDYMLYLALIMLLLS